MSLILFGSHAPIGTDGADAGGGVTTFDCRSALRCRPDRKETGGDCGASIGHHRIILEALPKASRDGHLLQTTIILVDGRGTRGNGGRISAAAP